VGVIRWKTLAASCCGIVGSGWAGEGDRMTLLAPLGRHHRALLPALLLATTAGGTGSFAGGTWVLSQLANTALLGLLVVVGLAAHDRRELADPLGVAHRAGWVWPAALWALVIAATLLSPVPRAGLAAVASLPLYLLAPLAVAGCWKTPAELAQGLRAVSVVVAGIALWALADWALAVATLPVDPVLGMPRAARPLGHHNLLAWWLLAATPAPIALLAASLRSPVRSPAGSPAHSSPTIGSPASRWLPVVTLALAAAALLATRSLAGLAGLAAGVVWWGVSGRAGRDGERPAPSREEDGRTRTPPRGTTLQGRRRLVGGLVGGGLLAVGLGAAWLAAPRLVAIVQGSDPSAAARRVYLDAALAGITARPLLGWGAGSTPWLAAAYLEPKPGVTPPSELVGDWHALPLAVGFELGLAGVGWLLAFLARLVWLLARSPSPAAPLARGVGFGLAGTLTAGLAGAPLAVPALPIAWLLLLGLYSVQRATIQSTAVQRAPVAATKAWSKLLSHALPVTALLVCALPLGRPWLASWHAERAIGAEAGPAVAHLERARRLDPSFPLWSARLALLSPEPGVRHEAARAATAAAPGVAPIALLVAATLPPDDPASLAAARLAVTLDPLAALPAWLLAWRSPDAAEASEAAAAALAAEPRLLAARAWLQEPQRLHRALDTLAGSARLDAGWRQELAARAARVLATPPGAASRELLVRLDGDPRLAASLFLFRRPPHPLPLVAVPLDADRLAWVADLATAPLAVGTDGSR
jgi:hypothetical protein